jgi:hypothetical protein
VFESHVADQALERFSITRNEIEVICRKNFNNRDILRPTSGQVEK